jgi:hypothetical protein
MVAEGESSFDVYRARFLEGPTPRLHDVERLSDIDDDMRAPVVSRDGRIVCVRVSGDNQKSSLWQRRFDQSIWSELGQETSAQTPLFLPRGDLLFSAITMRGDRDLFMLDRNGSRATVLDEPLGDEILPRVSIDGQSVFATSVLRANAGDVGGHVSLIWFDMHEPKSAPRILFDPSDTQARLGLALPPRTLDKKVLLGAPKYMDGLRRILLEKEVLREIKKSDK